MMQEKTAEDIYRCPHCGSIAAHGNAYCRGCGVKFSMADVEAMRRDKRSVVGALPWNTRDRFRCVHCNAFVAITDGYCRGCGDEIEDHERQLMRLKLSELAQQNKPALITLALFVILVILLSILIVQ